MPYTCKFHIIFVPFICEMGYKVTCACICIYVCTYACMCVYKCARARMRVCMCAPVCVYVYVYVFVGKSNASYRGYFVVVYICTCMYIECLLPWVFYSCWSLA